jgi:hypothetical protein
VLPDVGIQPNDIWDCIRNDVSARVIGAAIWNVRRAAMASIIQVPFNSPYRTESTVAAVEGKLLGTWPLSVVRIARNP